MIFRLALLLFLGLIGIDTVFGQSYSIGAIAIDRPWARPTAPSVKTGAVYFSLENKGSDPDRLVAASTPVAGKVEIHETVDEGGVMKMREVGSIEVAPGATVSLKPGGYHLMLLGLTQPLAEGQHVPLHLTFAKAGSVDIDVLVEKIPDGHPDMSGMDHNH